MAGIVANTVREVSSVSFGVLSAKDIIATSVCEVTNAKAGKPGNVNDIRMGTLENKIPCGTCGKGVIECPGHHGHIRLQIPVAHPMKIFQKMIVKFLNIYCFDCSKFLIKKSEIEIMQLPDNHSERIAKIVQVAKSKIECPHCRSPQPEIKVKDDVYTMKYSRKAGSKSRPLKVEMIKEKFGNIDPEDLKLIGMDPNRMHPEDLIITVLPVMPPCARPYVISGEKICDDDLTLGYEDIVKKNTALMGNLTEKDRKDKEKGLIFKIKTMMDNSKGQARLAKSRPIKCIKSRTNGKSKLVRNNIMGKRSDFTARTVAGPDPGLRTDEVGIPAIMRETLTYPEKVNAISMSYLEGLVNNTDEVIYVIRNKTKFPLKQKLWTRGTQLMLGDIVIRGDETINPFDGKKFVLQEGDTIIRQKKKIKTVIKKKIFFKLEMGDIVERKIKENDTVLLNRQPSLHKGSLLAKKVKFHRDKTVKIQLATTKTFNADFDGDELNLHVPQDPQSVIEAKDLFATQHNMISQQGSQCNITLVQDAVLGAFLMTKENSEMEKGDFWQLTMSGDNGHSDRPSGFDIDHVISGVEHYANVLSELKIDCDNPYTTRCLYSLLLPRNFNYESNNDGIPEEPVLKIYKGVIYAGAIKKGNISSSNSSIIRILEKEYGSKVAMNFVNNAQFIANAWLIERGFTVGLGDCLSNEQDRIQSEVTRAYMEADQAKHSTKDPRLRELKINAALNSARDIGRLIAKKAMGNGNGIATMTTSGAKGGFVNIAQLSGLLGQQNVSGGRIKPMTSGGLRTLQCYDFMDESYRGRGFVERSFIDGMRPDEMFFHAMGGREGLTDTAVKTSLSGYLQRRMTTFMADCQVQYDGTVRDSRMNIIQFNYGETSMDGSKLVKVKGKYQASSIMRMAERLNLDEEERRKKLGE